LAERFFLNEIFFSIQGESSRVGRPTTFVRLAGCPLRCSWCDTKYAFTEGRHVTDDEILDEVAKHPTRTVCVTGGEPMSQRRTPELLRKLVERGFDVSLETSGAVALDAVPEEVVRIIDVKCPGSGESHRIHWPTLEQLRSTDELKFVVADRADFDWALGLVRERKLHEKALVLFSPVAEVLAPRVLAEWILQSGAPVTLQLQLHKVLWGADVRGV
jgi:7-carboxy-7-deazaguanine synthase